VEAILGREETPDGARDRLEELGRLADTAGAEVVGTMTQRRAAIHPGTYIGHGKIEELQSLAVAKRAHVIIFDNDLTPAQIRNLERILEHKVLDRSELILDIFASRARTHEARLQVELAQLEYTAPRLRGMWTHLERIAGAGGATGVGAVGGIGTRGPGERQIETDRRIAAKRISLLKDQIAAIDRRKVREVLARKTHFTVSLVGYTNAGKSTLMNALTGAGAFTADRLFATLDTLTRRWDLGGGRNVLLSDTVGFIRDLPHHLVASFRATLEEAIHADLLLHVADLANPEVERQIAAVREVLAELGAEAKPALLLLNKADALADEALLTVLLRHYPDALPISAKTGQGLDRVREAVNGRTRADARRMTLSLPAHDGRALGFLERFAEILERRFEDDRAIFEVAIAPRALEHLHTIAADVRHAE